MEPTLFILDDDRSFVRAAGEMARQHGYQVHAAHTLAEAREKIPDIRADLLLLDLELPDGRGMDLLADIDLAEHGQVVVVTGSPSIESAMRAVSAPVMDYILKPLCPAQMARLLEQSSPGRWKKSVPSRPPGLDGFVGRSPAMQQVADTLVQVAASEATVLIDGESGTGKEVAARALHELSGRSGPFVAINCGAVPHELLASQLFGHERGSFTGAHGRHIGVFEQAAHGTLLLDEIGEMPAQLQVYLLRVLETGTVTRVGGSDAIPVPVRVVAATNRDPLAAVEAGRLREDLYYRLADVPITLPPLRERGDDVILLARMFIDRLNTRYHRSRYLKPRTEGLLLRHAWPGNVRELRSAVQRAYLLEPGDALTVRPAPPRPVLTETDSTIVFTVGTTLAEIERRALLKTLAHFDQDKTAAARALGISVRTVHNHLARLEAEDGRTSDSPA